MQEVRTVKIVKLSSKISDVSPFVNVFQLPLSDSPNDDIGKRLLYESTCSMDWREILFVLRERAGQVLAKQWCLQNLLYEVNLGQTYKQET